MGDSEGSMATSYNSLADQTGVIDYAGKDSHKKAKINRGDNSQNNPKYSNCSK